MDTVMAYARERRVVVGDVISCSLFAYGRYDTVKEPDGDYVLSTDIVWVGIRGLNYTWRKYKKYTDEDGWRVEKSKEFTLNTNAYDESRARKRYVITYTNLQGGGPSYDGGYPDGWYVKAVELDGTEIIQFYQVGSVIGVLPSWAEIEFHGTKTVKNVIVIE